MAEIITPSDLVRAVLLSGITAGSTTIDVATASAPYASPPDSSGKLAQVAILDSLSAPTKIEILTYTTRSAITGGYQLGGLTRPNAQAFSAGAYVIMDAGKDFMDWVISVAKRGGRKNKVMNGDFQVWQRGTSFSNANDYTADRWFVSASNNTGRTVSRQNRSLSDPGSGATFFLRLDATAQAAFDNRMFTFIEGTELAGKTVAVSFMARASSAVACSVSFTVFSDSSTSAAVSGVSGGTMSTTWKRHTIITTLPALPGAVNTSQHKTRFDVNFSNGAYWFDITDIQVEVGDVVTDFERLSYAEQRLMCERYAVALPDGVGESGANISIGQGYIASATQARLLIPLRTPIITTTANAMSILGTIGNLMIQDEAGATFVPSAIVNGGISSSTALVMFTIAGATAGRYCRMYRNADANTSILVDSDF